MWFDTWAASRRRGPEDFGSAVRCSILVLGGSPSRAVLLVLRTVTKISFLARGRCCAPPALWARFHISGGRQRRLYHSGQRCMASVSPGRGGAGYTFAGWFPPIHQHEKNQMKGRRHQLALVQQITEPAKMTKAPRRHGIYGVAYRAQGFP